MIRSRGTSGSAVNHEILGALSHFLVEIVHQHAHGSFLLPAFAGDGVATWRANGSLGLNFCFNRHA